MEKMKGDITHFNCMLCMIYWSTLMMILLKGGENVAFIDYRYPVKKQLFSQIEIMNLIIYLSMFRIQTKEVKEFPEKYKFF